MPNNPFGVLAFLHWNHNWNNFHFSDKTLKPALQQLKELGVSFVRVDILWSDIHTGFNTYNFERYDQLIKLIKDYDLQILALLHYNKNHVDSFGKEVWNRPPDSPEEFASYVYATVNHFKPFIKHWEIWNEPNLHVYWSAPKDNLAAYSHLLKLSYAAAKNADPDCQVLNGGLTEPLLDDLRHFYSNDIKNSFDILSIHTFIDPLSESPEKLFDNLITNTQKIMDGNGDSNKKIWITEMGCPGIPSGDKWESWFQGKGLSEDQQEKWLKTQFGFLKKYPRIEKMFWAFYRDTENIFHDATDHLGLVRFDLSPKPSFNALKEIITNWLPDRNIRG
jgi:sugar phosphate isomerase/epimerase